MLARTKGNPINILRPDVDNLIEAVDWQRNLAMDCGKLRGYGIRFDTTQEGIYHCLNDYGVADL